MKARIILMFLSVVGLVVLTGCDSSKSRTISVGPPEDLIIGTYKGDISALFWIAKDRGYFSDHGVNVQLKTHESGLESFNELLAGKIDLATITEFLFAGQALAHPDLRILSVVGQTDNMKLVARKDRGINQESDLKGKRIGLVRDSIAEYHLHLFLLLHRIPWKDIIPVNLPPSEEVKSILRGDIDAAIVWEPFAKQMQEGLGQNAISWSAQSGQDYYWLLVGTKDIVKRKSPAIQGVIAALVSAEGFIKKHRNEAKRITASQIGPNHMPELWETSGFTISLSRSLILAMKAELNWMNSSQGVQEFKVPNLMDYVHFETLESVNPEKVRTLR